MQKSDTGADREPDLIIRASSLAEMFDCSARWKAKHLLGLRTPSGAPAVIGTAVHAGTAVFDAPRVTGGKGDVGDAIEAAAEAARNPIGEVIWDDFRPSEAIDIAARLTNHYCHEIAPSFTYRKVEQQLDHMDVEATNGILLRFTGHVDREYAEGDQFGVADFKTGKQVVAADGSVKVSLSAAQLGTYELIELMAAGTEGERPTLDAKIIAMPTAGKRDPKVVTVKKPHGLLVGDDEHKGMIDIAAAYFKDDLFVGNPRSMLCSPRYCPVFNDCWWRRTSEG